MKKIPLTKGKFALVDDDDYLHLSQWKWNINDMGYAVRSVTTKISKKKMMVMGKKLSLGRFLNIKDAAFSRKQAEKTL
jgi:hypothetical protein